MGGRALIKDARFDIRVTGDEKALVERAAQLAHMSSSRFILQAALSSAEHVVAEHTRFILPPEKWAEFVAMLDRPAREVEALREAAAKPRPFVER